MKIEDVVWDVTQVPRKQVGWAVVGFTKPYGPRGKEDYFPIGVFQLWDDGYAAGDRWMKNDDTAVRFEMMRIHEEMEDDEDE